MINRNATKNGLLVNHLSSSPLLIFGPKTKQRNERLPGRTVELVSSERAVSLPS